MKPVLLEIVTKTITTLDHCSHCTVLFDEAGLSRNNRQKEIDEYPEDLKEEFKELSNWIRELGRLYKHRLLIRLIDAQSPVGIYKSLRHRIRKYPAFIVASKVALSGWDKGRLEEILDKRIKLDT